MNRLLAALLLLTAGTYADKSADTGKGHQNWPSLNELWNETETGAGIKQAISNSTLSAELLLGYEYSDLDANGTRPANAFLSRTRVNFQAGNYKGFSGFVQAQYVGPINDHYRAKDPAYDVVADPENFRFHQAYLSYKGYDSEARLGAQEIILDDARLIGNVGWRLNAQSFNAASVANHSVSNLTLFYAYTESINDIFGNLNHKRSYHLGNAEYKLNENNKVSAFAYLQRNDTGLKRLDTFGVRAWGKNDILTHAVMLAAQRDAYYGHVFGALDVETVNLGGGVEYISGGKAPGDRFQTLNGTAHKFNGWADQFLGTGGGLSGGLIDAYAQASSTVYDKLKLMAVYHYFHTTERSTAGFNGEYGQEIDALAKYPVCKNFDLLAKAAYYKKGKGGAGNFTSDETVFWLRGTLRF